MFSVGLCSFWTLGFLLVQGFMEVKSEETKIYSIERIKFISVCLGVVSRLKEIVVAGEEALRMTDALTSANFKILQLISEQPYDVSTIAVLCRMTDLSFRACCKQNRYSDQALKTNVSLNRASRSALLSS
jgi:hypothetical protein